MTAPDPPAGARFQPAWWLPSGHSQTLWAALARRRLPTPPVNEILELPDGDFLDLCRTPGNTGPLVIVLHGLEGSAASPYARGMMSAIAARGWRGVLMHFRGCSGRPNRLDRSYHSGDTGDIAYLVTELRRRHPGTPIAAVGYSLGGNALLKYLGESGSRSGLDCAVAVSVPYLLADGARRLDRGFSRLYQRHLLLCLQHKVAQKFRGREREVLGLDPARIRALDNFWKFDDAVTARLHGFRDVHDYYARSSSRQYLRHISIPTLLIHALDDPFMTPAAVPGPGELGNGVQLEVHARGGHVGFVGGPGPWAPRYWLEERIPDFLHTHIE